MENRYRDKLNTIIVAADYNSRFRTIYREFEKKIYLKIANKEPVHESLMELASSGCVPKPTYFFGATCYMQIELTQSNAQDLRDTIFSQLYPIIKNLSADNMNLMLRSIFESLSNKILRMDVVGFEELKDISYRDLLLDAKPFTKALAHQDPDTLSLLQSLPQQRDLFQKEYNNYIETLIHSRAGLWKLENLRQKEYEREIDSEFVLSSVKLK